MCEYLLRLVAKHTSISNKHGTWWFMAGLSKTQLSYHFAVKLLMSFSLSQAKSIKEKILLVITCTVADLAFFKDTTTSSGEQFFLRNDFSLLLPLFDFKARKE